jgi:ABC-type uncharacterized transport system auxiliary subunit
VLKVNSFATSPLYDSRRMIYRTAPFERQSYNYHRWIVDPGQMTASYLLRDFRNSGLFRAVLSFRSMEPARFLLSGEVEEFIEIDTREKGTAKLVVHLILWDKGNGEVSEWVLFENRYALNGSEVPQTADGLSKSMSEAMQRLSERVIRDVHGAVPKAQGR